MPPLSASELSNLALAQLKLLDPDISAEPLSLERIVIDAIAQVIADAQGDQFTQAYQFDIDSKIGSDLDRFIALFGFARLQGSRATGSVTFYLTSASSIDIQIPLGTQAVVPATSVTPALSFFTTASAVLYANTTSVEVPVQAGEIGIASNVPSNSIATMASGFATPISSVSNTAATTGGDDIESDAELRIRFKNTIFRNVSGTSDQYLALALATQFGRQANVIGSISRFTEFLQIPASLVISSQITYAKYTHPFDYYLTDGNTGNETFFNRTTDFVFTTNNLVPQTNPPTSVVPTLTIENSTDIPAGSIVYLEHSYCSLNSRNDPSLNILNKVDIYVAGQDIQQTTETLLFPSSDFFFSTVAGATYNRTKWRRQNSPINPTAGNTFQLLTWQSVTELPSAITIGSMTFFLGSDYYLVKDITNYKGSRQGRDGIEWTSAAADMIAWTTSYTIDYDWNRLPITINSLIDSQKQMSSDVLVHAATQRFFNINTVQTYTQGFSTTAVDSNVIIALTTLFNNLTYGAVIKISVILDAIHRVPGVDNVRLATPADGGPYGIQEIAADGATTLGAPYTTDFSLLDSDLPVLNSVVVSKRSQNTYNGL